MPYPVIWSAPRCGGAGRHEARVSHDQDALGPGQAEVVADLVGRPAAELQLRRAIGEHALGMGGLIAGRCAHRLPFRLPAGRNRSNRAVSYTHLRAHETVLDLVCRLLLEKKNK